MPNISEQKIDEIYDNYVALMNRAREGKEMSRETFKSILDKVQVFNYKDTYIFGNYDLETATFITRFSSSPTSKELLAEVLPALVKQGIDFISFVPKDVADKYKRSGYTVSEEGFDYNFKGEQMIKYATMSNPNISLKIFDKPASEISSQHIEGFSEGTALRYKAVEIKGELIEKAGKDLSNILETYLNQFGIVVKDIEEIKEQLKIDELGFADILSKIAYIEDRKDLPPIAGEFIAYMMQYNPLVSEVINELIQKNIVPLKKKDIISKKDGKISYDYKKLDKTRYFKFIGQLISDDLQNKLEGNYSKSLIIKIKELINNFFKKLRNKDISTINKNIGYISNNILQQNKKLITSSLYKPGAPNKKTILLSLEGALKQDKFGAEIVETLSKKGFILAGSIALAEQGTVLRPDENPLHDIDWVSPFSRKETIKKFKETYPEAQKVGDIIGDKVITDSYIIAPKGYKIINLKSENNRNIPEFYNVIDKDNNIVGTYKILYVENQRIELVEGIQGKMIDFFSYESYNGKDPYKKNSILLSN